MNRPCDIVAGDFNRDGKLDIAISRPYVPGISDGQITIHLGDGAGHFSDRSIITTGQLTDANLAVGDLNGDGILDLVAGPWNSILIHWGRGDGTFGSPSQFASFGASYVLIGDVNNDGHPDIVAVTSYGDNAVVLLGDGSGQFTASLTLFGVDDVGGAALADFKGDGKLDLTGVKRGQVGGENGYAGFANVGWGTGMGSFAYSAWSGSQPFPGAIMWYGLAVADFNGDGFLDIVAGEMTSSRVGQTRLWLNDGTGASFTQTDHLLPGAANNNSYNRQSRIIAADFNRDGRPDLAITDGVGSISVAINQPDYHCDDFINLSYNSGTLNMAFTVGTWTPVNWNTWLVLSNNIIPLWSVPVPVVQPSVSFNLPVPGFPSIGTVGVLTLTGNSTYGLMCGDFATVDTGGLMPAAGVGRVEAVPARVDVNGDGVVDCADLRLVWGAYGRTQGQAGFNPRADVNGDGVVDVKDLAMVLRQLGPGQKCR